MRLLQTKLCAGVDKIDSHFVNFLRGEPRVLVQRTQTAEGRVYYTLIGAGDRRGVRVEVNLGGDGIGNTILCINVHEPGRIEARGASPAPFYTVEELAAEENWPAVYDLSGGWELIRRVLWNWLERAREIFESEEPVAQGQQGQPEHYPGLDEQGRQEEQSIRGAPRLEEQINADVKKKVAQDYLTLRRKLPAQVAADRVGYPYSTLKRWVKRFGLNSDS